MRGAEPRDLPNTMGWGLPSSSMLHTRLFGRPNPAFPITALQCLLRLRLLQGAQPRSAGLGPRHHLGALCEQRAA